METTNYILSQIFIIISYIISISTYQLKKRNLILLLNLTATSATAISYILLSASTGLAMTLVAAIRNIIFLINTKKKKKDTKKEIAILMIIYAITIYFAITTYESIFSLMSVSATMIYTFSVWQKDTKVFKLLGIPVGITAIIYTIYIKSIFGTIFEILITISAITGLIKDTKKEKKKATNKLQIQLQN